MFDVSFFMEVEKARGIIVSIQSATKNFVKVVSFPLDIFTTAQRKSTREGKAKYLNANASATPPDNIEAPIVTNSDSRAKTESKLIPEVCEKLNLGLEMNFLKSRTELEIAITINAKVAIIGGFAS
jgi:hypothetical protein